jgi:hypothetical protein
MVERALIYPPRSRLNPLTMEERTQIIRNSVLYGHYEKTIDRESAYEKLKARTEPIETAPAGSTSKTNGMLSQTGDLLGAMAKSAAHAIGSQIGRQIIRGVLGSMFGGTRRR